MRHLNGVWKLEVGCNEFVIGLTTSNTINNKARVNEQARDRASSFLPPIVTIESLACLAQTLARSAGST